MGLLDTMKKNLDEFKKAKWKTVSDYEKEGGPKVPGPTKRVVVKKTEVATDVPEDDMPPTDEKGNYIKPRPYKKGGSVKSSASRRADGCAVRGKTKGRMV